MKIETVAEMIHVVRGQRVMLDVDLAPMYGVPTKRLNEQVQRNLRRFPPDFMFRLTAAEYDILKSQFATSRSGWGGRRKWPRAFTQEGVAMLSSVLSSPLAVDVNVAIMRAFVRLRGALSADRDLPTRMKNAEDAIAEHDRELNEHAVQFNEAFAQIRRLDLEKRKQPVKTRVKTLKRQS